MAASPRRLRPADLPGVASLERATFSDPWSQRAFSDLLMSPDVGCFAIDGADGALCGYGICRHAADEGEILNLAVAASARRQGAGAALAAGMVAWLRSQGVGRVFLEVRRSNEAAIGLYRALGFRTVGTRRGYYARPREDALVMALELASETA
jgi:ribosomal-protein-alanine N-acetyltransferase